MDNTNELLQNFLNIHWIRPEVAMWRTLDSIQLKKIQFKKPMIDLGCGDGTFSFTNFKGKTGLDFDVYGTIKNTKGFFEGKDIQNQKSILKPTIIKKTNNTFDVAPEILVKELAEPSVDDCQAYVTVDESIPSSSETLAVNSTASSASPTI